MALSKSSLSSKKSKEGNNFWEIGGYTPTARRLANGIKSVEELRSYFHERAQLSLNYAKELTELSNKWTNKINKSDEYGTTKEAWQSILEEPSELARYQAELAVNLNSKQSEMKNWTQNKTKLLFKNKNVKDHDSRFRIAQKEWTDRVRHMRKTKADYDSISAKLHNHGLKKNISALEQGTAQETEKAREKTSRLQKEQEYCRAAYVEGLRLVNDRKDCYSQEMTRIFDSCQQVERERIEYFISIALEQISMFTQDNTVSRAIYDQLEEALALKDPDKSLQYWYQQKGPCNPLQAYDYEETPVQEDMNTLARMSLRHSTPTDTCSDSYKQFAKMSLSRTGVDDTICQFNGGKTSSAKENGDCLPDHQAAVVAMYDYEAQEADELSFRAGQRLFRFSEEDENGWAKCMDEDGKYGYVPFKFIRDESIL